MVSSSIDMVDATTTTAQQDNMMPANLKRKVHAKRPALGHIVPQHLKAKGGGGSANPSLRPQGKARDAGLNNPSLLKILGGSAKGKRLDSPQVYLRPMMGKVKEAVFSSFFSLGLYSTGMKHVRHLDIFSGSGSVGLESLSRGATHCTFVDLSEDCCAAAKRNMEWCFGSTTTTSTTQPSVADEDEMMKTHQIVCADYLQALRDPASVGIDPSIPYQIVTLCPPYEEVIYADLLDAVANSPVVSEDTVVLVEYPVELQTLPHVIPRRPQHQEQATSSSITKDSQPGALIGIRNRKYGRTVIALYVCNPTGKLQGVESRPEEFV
jgi:16S rRNA (guanine966-N2)-methyltransferase